MFLHNAWYVAAWDHELADGLLARTFLGEDVVLYRDSAGAPVALENRCCHRHLPLSEGRLLGDRIQCGYHGLEFDRSGACVRIPGQSRIPPGAVVRAYPVVERYRCIWIWMGDPAAADDLITFKYEDQGVATLEDGLYVLEENLSDPAFVDKMERFVRASMKGWKYAEENPDEAAEIVLEYDETGAQTEKHQKRMMGEIAKLTAGSNGSLDPADYERTVASLLSGGSDPVISKAPEGAWTHAITDKALN